MSSLCWPHANIFFDIELIHSALETLAMRTGRILVALIFLALIVPFQSAKCKAAPKSVQVSKGYILFNTSEYIFPIFNRMLTSVVQPQCQIGEFIIASAINLEHSQA